MLYHTSPCYSITIRLSMEQSPEMLGLVTSTIGSNGGMTGAVSIVSMEKGRIVRDLVVQACETSQEQQIVNALATLSGVTVLSVKDRTFDYHEGGKIQIKGKRELKSLDDLAIAYTPGVARVSLEVAKDLNQTYKYTIKGNSVAVVTDGTAVLGLGNIGPMGALPVMEGKALLFKELAGIDAFPICLNVTDPGSIVDVVNAISPGFGGINLEDISAPRCFEVETRLKRELKIPVFHDDQHGTAVVILAGLYNALRIVKKDLKQLKIVISGVGAAGVACARMLLQTGATNIIACDRAGAIYGGRLKNMNPTKEVIARMTNPQGLKGDLKDALVGADVLIGVSSGDLLKPSDLKVMADDPIVFALANPTPEVDPDGARDYARIVATGRSDYPNQINNALVFPGIFRGALDARAKEINASMKIAAARAIAAMIPPDELEEDHIMVDAFHPGVAIAVGHAVERAAFQSGAA